MVERRGICSRAHFLLFIPGQWRAGHLFVIPILFSCESCYCFCDSESGSPIGSSRRSSLRFLFDSLRVATCPRTLRPFSRHMPPFGRAPRRGDLVVCVVNLSTVDEPSPSRFFAWKVPTAPRGCDNTRRDLCVTRHQCCNHWQQEASAASRATIRRRMIRSFSQKRKSNMTNQRERF